METVEQQIVGIISRESGIPLDIITPQSTLRDLNVESLDALEIFFSIEDHFKIQLPDNSPDFDTGSVSGLVAAVQQLVMEKAGGGTAA
jgi:acyl carrier protein